MSAERTRRWTAREVRQLIADAPSITPRYELVDGELLLTETDWRSDQSLIEPDNIRIKQYRL